MRVVEAATLMVGFAVPNVTLGDTRLLYTRSPTLSALVPPTTLSPPADDNWWSGFGEPADFDATVNALTSFGGDLIAGGDFTQVGSVMAPCLAAWDGFSWRSLQATFLGSQPVVFSLTVFKQKLVVAGSFVLQNGTDLAVNIAEWDGHEFRAFATPAPVGRVTALAVMGDVLAVGGDLGVATWNGFAWTTIANGTNGSILCLGSHAGYLAAGGHFAAIDGVAANRIALWDGVAWQPLSSGMNGGVFSIVWFGGQLVAGGDFAMAGGSPASRVARWNGQGWEQMGTNTPGLVYALNTQTGQLYCGGAGLHRWNGSDWTPVSGTEESLITYLTSFEGNLAARGSLRIAPALHVQVALHVGGAWSRLGSGVSDPIHALHVHNDALIAGGAFSESPLNNIATWNGSQWLPLGVGVFGDVLSLTSFGESLIAGGDFLGAGGGVNANNIAEWNGSWRALGTFPQDGVNGQVNALATFQGRVVAGGEFTTAGGAPANYIAQWDGSSWSGLDTGMNGPVRALAVHDGMLVAGGDFNVAGDVLASHIAGWNGSDWAPLAAGVDDTVFALATTGSTLVAGGSFSFAGTGFAHRIAEWNGSAWSPACVWANGPVRSLAVFDGLLVAGGDFTWMDGGASRVAKRIGNQWQPLGSGANRPVSALAVYNYSLFAGGTFTVVGSKPSLYIARWDHVVSDVVLPRADPGMALEIRQARLFTLPVHVSYTLSRPDVVRLGVYDVSGRCVERLEDGPRSPGAYSVIWPARSPTPLPSGVYLVVLRGDYRSIAHKVTLIR